MFSWLENNFLIKFSILEQKFFQELNYMTEDPQVDLFPPHAPCPICSACVMPVTLMKIQLKIARVEKPSLKSVVSLRTLEHKWLSSPGQCFTEALE